jgi:LPXTG-motif cell wall-anchored protein
MNRRFLLNAILTLLILLAIANLVFWFLAIGSGHMIPRETTNTILLSLGILGVLIAIVIAFKRKEAKRFRK